MDAQTTITTSRRFNDCNFPRNNTVPRRDRSRKA